MLLWLLFVFQLSSGELIASAVACALTVLVLRTVLQSVSLCFEPRPGWLAQAWRVPGTIAKDVPILLRNLICHIIHKPGGGVLLAARFRSGAGCRGAAQRALATLFLSTAPNSVVIDIDASESTISIHQLTATPLPKLARKLEE